MEKSNAILNKNLECIEKYNPDLKEKLLKVSYSADEITFVETRFKEPNLSYKGIPLHSFHGALAEAKNIFKSVSNLKVSRHVVFGIGLGYLFRECCENSKGMVFLYEPNLEILRIALESIDFSDILSKENVFITSEMEVFKKLYNGHYTYHASTDFLTLHSYRTFLYKDEIDEIVKKMEIIVGSCDLNVKNLMQKSQSAIEMVIKNIYSTLNATPLLELKDIYKGKTALVISAGPSLDLNIQTIKKNRDKFIIFCVGTAFKTLNKNDITPDFINLIENKDCSNQLSGADLSKINLISEPYTHSAIYNFNVKQNFLFPTQTYTGNGYWSNLVGVDISEYLVKGTVSYSALASAKMLGFSKIILVGQDLVYLNNKRYSSGSSVLADSSPKADDSFYYVKGISGEMLPTNVDYAAFIGFLSEFAYDNPKLELINTSMLGAQIDGFKNIPFEDAIKNLPNIKKIKLPKAFKYDKKKIAEKLECDSEKLVNILNDFGEAELYILDYEEAFDKTQALTKESGQAFAQMLELYQTINSKYADFQLYKIISFADTVDIDYRVANLQSFNENDLNEFYGILKNFYRSVKIKIISIMQEISAQKQLIESQIN